MREGWGCSVANSLMALRHRDVRPLTLPDREKLLGYDCAIFFLHFLLVGIHEIVKIVLGLLACGIEFKDHLGYLIVIQRVQEFLELCLRHFAEWGLFRFPECKLVQLTHRLVLCGRGKQQVYGVLPFHAL